MNPFILLAGLAGLFLVMGSDTNSAPAPEPVPVETKRQLLVSYVRQKAKSVTDQQALLAAIAKMEPGEVEDVYLSLITYASRGLRPVRSPQVLAWWGRLSAIAVKYGLSEDLVLGN